MQWCGQRACATSSESGGCWNTSTIRFFAIFGTASKMLSTCTTMPPPNFLRNSSSSIFRYLVVDLMNGGDLRFHISRKAFTDDAVRFWIAELGCALRYIHQQGIIHRDVKPDNVLLDSEGHIHLADFVGTFPQMACHS